MTKHQNTVTAVSVNADVPPIEQVLKSAVDRGADTLDELRSRIAEIAAEAKQRGSALADRATALATTRPWTAVAVAFGAGYVAMRVATSSLTRLAVVGGLLYVGGGLLRK